MQRADNSRTTQDLLGRLGKTGEDDAWNEFDARYRPIAISVARRLGLTRNDAEDAAQQAMLDFLREWNEHRYDESRSRLRTWLLAIVRHRAIDFLRARNRRQGHMEETDAERVPASELEQTWDDAVRNAMLAEAMTRLRSESKTEERTILVFERVALQSVPAEAVAAEFGMTAADVYRIKSRLVDRLRSIVADVELAWTDVPDKRS